MIASYILLLRIAELNASLILTLKEEILEIRKKSKSLYNSIFAGSLLSNRF